ncbi:MAG: pyridoxamine 5'-phosphate oxidase family protein [Gammaproteobacteria bacterium]|jgi:uncharacterized protein YhbP (UPF0306 family)|nr:pyridoxamine 5'-phosphate oxidase family protein [Gammaproteobacteria bacterium]
MTTGDSAELRATALAMLEATSTLTLATTSASGLPWAATVFFAADRALNLYFVSDHRTRHARDTAAHPHAAAAINPDCDNWHAVKGIQAEGPVSIVSGLERGKALALYLRKFPQIDALYAAPADEHEATIAKRLQSANFYKLAPVRMRVIDNSRGFGWRAEIEFGV